jgi:putative ABC transport system permease protein
MVMKAFGKTMFRLFKKHLVRLITIIAIVTVSIGVVSGIGEVENRIKLAITDYYKEQNVSDFIIKSKRGAFSAEELEKISQKFSTDKLLFSFGYELDTDGEITRVCSLNLNEADINKPKLLSGRFPQSESEIAVERATDKLKSYEIGETVTLNGVSYTVCGSVLSPLYINKIEETSFAFESRNLSYVVYSLPSAIQPVNDVYVALTDRTEFRALSKSYKNLTARVKSELETELHTENVSVLSLFENTGFYSLISYAEKVQLIGIVFVVFFLLVTMLVVYSNMSRLFDEERG